MSKRYLKWIIFVQALIATLGSLYYGRFGDIVLNISTGMLFDRSNGLDPCELCWFARIFMYPIVIIAGAGLLKKFDTVSILVLSCLGILLETYQYRFQMTKSSSEIKSVICGVGDQASCAATDVIYRGFITIPLLCLLAFIVIFVTALLLLRRKK